MNIKIEINFEEISDIEKVVKMLRPQLEEIILFLDCQTVQGMISKYRDKINLDKLIPYEEFDKQIKKVPIQYNLTQSQMLILHELECKIDNLENRIYNDLSDLEKDEWNESIRERKKWQDPFFLFTKDIEKELIHYRKDDYTQILVKAIFCGEIREKEIRKIAIKRNRSRSVTYYERIAYWIYNEDTKVGYGLVGKKLRISPKTITSRVNAYTKKLLDYDNSLHTS